MIGKGRQGFDLVLVKLPIKIFPVPDFHRYFETVPPNCISILTLKANMDCPRLAMWGIINGLQRQTLVVVAVGSSE